MNSVVAHLVSGQVLFTALPLMVAMLLLCDAVTRPDLRRLVTVMAWNLGLLGVSTAAAPLWAIGLLVATLGLWSSRTWLPDRKSLQRICMAGPIVTALGMLIVESAWIIRPAVTPVTDRSVVVLGDSLSAGLGEGEGAPWPSQLRDQYHVQVYNLSEAGATTEDAFRTISATDHFPGLVVIELGGNDLLGGRPLADFERDLQGILAHLRQQNRSVVMVELPLLPGKNQWGVVQRQLADRFSCPLIPKRLLVQVLAAPGATVDTLHLSRSGHLLMAEAVWRVIEPGLPRS